MADTVQTGPQGSAGETRTSTAGSFPDVSYLVTSDPTRLGGNGTTADPLTTIDGGTGVVADGITIVGDGTTGNPLVALGAAATTIYFNVKAYGANGDGTNQTTQCNNCEAAAAAVTGGTVFYPNGRYVVSEVGTTLKCLSWSSGVSFVGQSWNAIIQLADAQRESVRILWPSHASNLSIESITLDGNKAGQSGPNTFHRDLIFLDNCSHIEIENVQLQNGFASGLVIWQNTTDCTVSNTWIHDNTWQCIALGDAGGQQRIHVEYTRGQNNAGGFHVETSVAASDITILDCEWDASAGNAALNIVGGGGGTDATKCVSNVKVFGGKINGAILVASAIDVLVEGTTIVCADAAPTPLPAIKVSGQVQGVTFDNVSATLAAGGTAAQAVWFAGNNHANTLDVSLINSHVYVQTATADGVTLQDLPSATVKNTDIYGQSAAGFYGINMNAKNDGSGRLTLQANHVEAFDIGIVAQSGSSSFHTALVEIIGNDFSTMTTACMSLDKDGHHTIQQASISLNEEVGGLTMFATYPNVPFLIGGNRNGIGIYSCAGAPAFAAPIGSQALRRDPDAAGHIAYLNLDGTGGGWHAVNVT